MSKCEYINTFSYTKFLELMERLAKSNDPDATSVEHHIVMENSAGETYDMVISFDDSKKQWGYKWKLRVEETVEQPVEQPVATADETKIIVVTYESGETKWFPFTLENMEIIISEHSWIDDIQIVERG